MQNDSAGMTLRLVNLLYRICMLTLELISDRVSDHKFAVNNIVNHILMRNFKNS